jgi:adenylate kinase family enzyme
MASTQAHDPPMRRVLVVGCAGAGKTTFARRLGDKLKLPVVHLDFRFWRPDCQAPEHETWREQVVALAAQPEWIMDGNYSSTYDIRMPRADSLVWLDYPRRVCMRRVVLRMIKGYGRTRPDLPSNCPERLNLEFLRFVWSFPRAHRPHIVNGIATYGSHLSIATFNRDRNAENFLAASGAP